MKLLSSGEGWETEERGERFHHLGPETAKPGSPFVFSLVLGTSRSSWLVDHPRGQASKLEPVHEDI